MIQHCVEVGLLLVAAAEPFDDGFGYSERRILTISSEIGVRFEVGLQPIGEIVPRLTLLGAGFGRETLCLAHIEVDELLGTLLMGELPIVEQVREFLGLFLRERDPFRSLERLIASGLLLLSRGLFCRGGLISGLCLGSFVLRRLSVSRFRLGGVGRSLVANLCCGRLGLLRVSRR